MRIFKTIQLYWKEAIEDGYTVRVEDISDVSFREKGPKKYFDTSVKLLYLVCIKSVGFSHNAIILNSILEKKENPGQNDQNTT